MERKEKNCRGQGNMTHAIAWSRSVVCFCWNVGFVLENVKKERW
jgi:hypothetical protein